VNERSIRSFWSEPIGSLALQQTLVVDPETPVADAIRRMQEQKRGCVCVADASGKVVGIFTERDVMTEYVGQSTPPETPIKAVMTANPTVIQATAALSEAIEIFRDKRFHHMPVLAEDGSLQGLLSARVVVNFVAENLPGEVLNLPPDRSIISQQKDGG
jgi:CBS domain-containing protein